MTHQPKTRTITPRLRFPRPRRVGWSFWIAAALSLGVTTPLPALIATPRLQETRVKAAFLYNFFSFVEWPGKAPEDPFILGVLGKDPFGSILDRTFHEKNVKGRPIEIRRLREIREASQCDIVFVGSISPEQSTILRESLSKKPVLTVSDLRKSASTIGIVEFFREGNKVRFSIDRTRASEAGLKISSRLLRLAKRPGE